MRSVSQGSGRFHNTRGYQPFWKPIDAKRTAPVVETVALAPWELLSWDTLQVERGHFTISNLYFPYLDA
ncbi:hypothetical protein PCASD_10310 [Puccinia coronata f. sp. avenae]|uniref:Uncharacterized protein n=1 Tax=Puccinia coronata f. sp. avenae TaxID=200324 RepID=A0A2N5SH64_9BASI|nr:hypothetical protein PCASD_17154 [Puccinia coronata f. sp. avenae]PLW33699.1 hypothetical protein PCASD_10310 [Puccinia coronata f. sp. avenae]